MGWFADFPNLTDILDIPDTSTKPVLTLIVVEFGASLAAVEQGSLQSTPSATGQAYAVLMWVDASSTSSVYIHIAATVQYGFAIQNGSMMFVGCTGAPCGVLWVGILARCGWRAVADGLVGFPGAEP